MAPMADNAPPLVFDRARWRKRRERAAETFAQADFLKARVADGLIDRLEDTSHLFPLALDLDAHRGNLSAELKASGKVDHVIAMDSAAAMAHVAAARADMALAADAENLPFAEDSLDLVASALGLHWVNDLPGALIQIRQALKPDGLFLGALFGAGTLTELREAFLIAETELTGGARPRISPLPGLQDIAGLLQRAGFALPVADIEHVTVRYDTPFHLMNDLGLMGERSALKAASGGLSRRILARMGQVYAERFADPDGRLRASFEIIWLSGWAPAPHQPKPLKPGSGKVNLAEAVRGSAKG